MNDEGVKTTDGLEKYYNYEVPGESVDDTKCVLKTKTDESPAIADGLEKYYNYEVQKEIIDDDISCVELIIWWFTYPLVIFAMAGGTIMFCIESAWNDAASLAGITIGAVVLRIYESWKSKDSKENEN